MDCLFSLWVRPTTHMVPNKALFKNGNIGQNQQNVGVFEKCWLSLKAKCWSKSIKCWLFKKYSNNLIWSSEILFYRFGLVVTNITFIRYLIWIFNLESAYLVSSRLYFALAHALSYFFIVSVLLPCWASCALFFYNDHLYYIEAAKLQLAP
jgi:hypothetical protein